MKEDRSKIKACVGVMVFKDGKVLMGKRKGAHGEGEYSFTGGHLEFGESFFECAKRETKEESGIEIKNIKFLCIANYLKHENRQDILLGVTADWGSGVEEVMEPHKCEDWGWYSLDDLPSPIFYPSQVLINSYKEGVNFYDKE